VFSVVSCLSIPIKASASISERELGVKPLPLDLVEAKASIRIFPFVKSLGQLYSRREPVGSR